ncbi:hypothetical protein EJ06DRAFT_347140 [Trichodelitschia bisporula]|uniref:Uncharacterized protein n=1 Tax=Trichodelitschia bisporula TaxID=703511 RepID=A0A6G1I337_9PEZI|nr:hypothetical protein EJ06DRAFT_347140 [Trichodelitschia bisporula]
MVMLRGGGGGVWRSKSCGINPTSMADPDRFRAWGSSRHSASQHSTALWVTDGLQVFQMGDILLIRGLTHIRTSSAVTSGTQTAASLIPPPYGSIFSTFTAKDLRESTSNFIKLFSPFYSSRLPFPGRNYPFWPTMPSSGSRDNCGSGATVTDRRRSPALAPTRPSPWQQNLTTTGPPSSATLARKPVPPSRHRQLAFSLARLASRKGVPCRELQARCEGRNGCIQTSGPRYAVPHAPRKTLAGYKKDGRRARWQCQIALPVSPSRIAGAKMGAKENGSPAPGPGVSIIPCGRADKGGAGEGKGRRESHVWFVLHYRYSCLHTGIREHG